MTQSHRPSGRDEILDAVLDAAERLFAKSSPTEVSLREIAREADVTYGLVHRHFGTKEALIEQLLLRFQQRWADRLDREPPYEDALDYILGPRADTGAYLRLVAWMLLAGKGAASPDTHRRYVELDRLLTLPGSPGDGIPTAGTTTVDGGLDESSPAIATAAALAFVFGWRFFNPFIRAALPLDNVDADDLQQAMRAELRRIHQR